MHPKGHTRAECSGYRAVVFTAVDHTDLAWKCFRLRKRIFVDGRGWPLRIDAGAERDEFDRRDTVYGAVVDRIGEPVACWRMLPTTAPCLLSRVFPHLMDQAAAMPTGLGVWEISRFGVDPDHPRPTAVIRTLLELMFNFADERRIATIVAVSDIAFERILRRIGCRMFRYGCDGRIVAGGLHVAEQPSVLRGTPGMEVA